MNGEIFIGSAGSHFLRRFLIHIRLPTKDDNGRGPNEVRAYCPSETWLKGKGEQIPAIAAVSCERCLLCASLNIAGIFFPGLLIRRKRAGQRGRGPLVCGPADPWPRPLPLPFARLPRASRQLAWSIGRHRVFCHRSVSLPSSSQRSELESIFCTSQFGSCPAQVILPSSSGQRARYGRK